MRAINSRTKTPLGLALRGRFLVGSQPVASDFVPRFVASAAENGIEIFRLHDPLNDVSNLREAGQAITAAGREFDAGLIYSPGVTGGTEQLVEQAKKLPDLGASRVLLHDASGALTAPRAHELVSALAEASGLPVGMYGQGAAGNALAANLEAARAGADRLACAVYPIALLLHRVSGEALATSLAGLNLDSGVDVDTLWEAAELIDEHIGDEPVTPLPTRVSVRAAQHKLPAGLVAAIDARLRTHGAADRLDEVLDELILIRTESGSPPLAAPIGQILASQAIIHVLSASRYQTVVDELRDLLEGSFGTPPGRSTQPSAARASSLEPAAPESRPRISKSCARTPPGSPRARRSCSCSHSSETKRSRCSVGSASGDRRGDAARRWSRPVASRADPRDRPHRSGERRRRDRTRGGRDPGLGAPDRGRVARDSGEAPPGPLADRAAPGRARAGDRRSPSNRGADGRTFYRASQPGAPPFVEEGDVVAAGQTLCILEAMKLMNEVKTEVEGVVRAIRAEWAAGRVRAGAVRPRARDEPAARRLLMFNRVLIANRGEVAVRVIQRCTSSASRPSSSTRPPTKVHCMSTRRPCRLCRPAGRDGELSQDPVDHRRGDHDPL